MRQKGFSLIELMVALVLGLLIVQAALSLFLSSSRNYGQDQKIAALQDEMRFAIAQLTQDVEMAGFWAPLLNPGNITLHADLTIGSDCGPTAVTRWMYTDLTPLAALDNVVSASAAAAGFQCIASSEIKLDTDVLSIKRVAGINMVGQTLNANQIYLDANASSGTLFKQPATGLGTTLANVWAYQPVIYFIRPYSVRADENPLVPALCRKYLLSGPSTAPTMSTECIASGVEDFQVEFGIDSNADGAVESFLSSPTATQLGQTSLLRVSLLIRSSSADNGYSNAKTYTLGNKAAFTPADKYYRRVISSVIALRNPLALRVLNQ